MCTQERKVDNKQKQRLKVIFNQFASDKDTVNNEPLMTPEDFIRSVVQRRKDVDEEFSAKAASSPTLRVCTRSHICFH